VELPYAAQASSVAFAPDGRRLAWIVDPMKRVVIWDAARRQPVGELPLDRLPEGNAVVDLAFSPDGRTIATSSRFVGALGDAQEQEGVALWNLQDRRPRLLPIDQKETTGVVFTTDGRTLVSFGADGSILFVDVATGQVQGRWSTGEAGLAADVSPDGRYLAVEQHDGSVVLWETSTRRRLGTLGSPSAASGGLSMRFSSDGNALAIANPDGVITLWDLRSRRPQKVLQFSQAADIAVATETIAAATPNGTIVLWDIQSGQQLGVLEDAGSKRS
jgi:WD40 repeat protein